MINGSLVFLSCCCLKLFKIRIMFPEMFSSEIRPQHLLCVHVLLGKCIFDTFFSEKCQPYFSIFFGWTLVHASPASVCLPEEKSPPGLRRLLKCLHCEQASCTSQMFLNELGRRTWTDYLHRFKEPFCGLKGVKLMIQSLRRTYLCVWMLMVTLNLLFPCENKPFVCAVPSCQEAFLNANG